MREGRVEAVLLGHQLGQVLVLGLHLDSGPRQQRGGGGGGGLRGRSGGRGAGR